MDDERFEAPPPGDELDPESRLSREWQVLALEDGGAEHVVYLRSSVIDRIRRQTDGTVSYFVRRGLDELAEHLEEEAARYVPGSTAPPVTPYRAPKVDHPVPREEIRALAEWIRHGAHDAVASARRAYGEPTVPARVSPRPSPAREDLSRELGALARRFV
jgi:hypothetical protein